MAILGTFVDKTTISRAGDDLSGVTVATLSHSLPATNPDMLLPILRSTQAQGHNPGVSLLGLGANASISTIGFRISSTASCPVLLLDVFAVTFFSMIR